MELSFVNDFFYGGLVFFIRKYIRVRLCMVIWEGCLMIGLGELLFKIF